MSAAIAILLLALQAPAAAQQASTAPEASGGAAAETHVASVRDTLREIRERSEAEQHERALELAAVLAGSLEWEQAPERERAEGSYLLGVARERAAQRAGAVSAFRSGAALAGPGELRLDALYNAGAVLLEDAEELRLRIPEVRSKLGLPPLDPQPGGAVPPPLPSAKGKDGPDDLELARGRYREARAELALRLRAAPARTHGDVDTRANLELIQRRLRELDAIEREREEQKQQEQQQQESDPSQDPEQEQGDPGQDPQQQDPSQDPEQEKPEDQEGQEKEREGEDEQPEQPDPGKEDETKTEDQKDSAAKEAAEERLLSREEVQRLLDQLQAIDEKARAVRAALQSRRRVPVERDW